MKKTCWYKQNYPNRRLHHPVRENATHQHSMLLISNCMTVFSQTLLYRIKVKNWSKNGPYVVIIGVPTKNKGLRSGSG